ncbi:hypothetical protein EDC01DRAFT_69921 [Geopyxis carbonaria]|nr:hypothetical protein EDC01DRAFT_69921 [Geopyxis carbonaria]
MASSQVTAQLKHLREAAYALSKTSPAVSAHLMSRFHSISSEKGVSLSVLDQRAWCSACGTIRVTEQTDTFFIEGNRPQIRMNSRENQYEDRDPSEPSQMAYTCGACGKITTEDISTRPPKKQAKKRTQSEGIGPTNHLSVAETSTSGIGGVVTPDRPEPPMAASRHPQASGNSSRPSRKKTRKGSSLSSLLAAQRQTEGAGNGRGLNGVGGGFGLDLMDLMKTR